MDTRNSKPMSKVKRTPKNKLSLTELSAEISNKINPAQIILAALKADKKITKRQIVIALKDLGKVEELIS